MLPLTAVVAQSDPESAAALAKSLLRHFHTVRLAGSLEEVRAAIPRHRAEFVIVDLELIGITEVEQLRRDFASLSIVCTHRLPDEKLWTSALAAGALDCCHASDVRSIVLAAMRNPQASRPGAA
jgi:DNA-binding response OmpR family regulator